MNGDFHGGVECVARSIPKRANVRRYVRRQGFGLALSEARPSLDHDVNAGIAVCKGHAEIHHKEPTVLIEIAASLIGGRYSATAGVRGAGKVTVVVVALTVKVEGYEDVGGGAALLDADLNLNAIWKRQHSTIREACAPHNAIPLNCRRHSQKHANARFVVVLEGGEL